MGMSLGWFWPILLFSLRDINLTLGLLPPRKHVVWRDSVGVESSGSGLKIIVRGHFASEFSLLRHTDEPQKGRNSSLWLQTRYVLSSFGLLLMSCRVKFHVVRSALQYSACRIICLHFYFCWSGLYRSYVLGIFVCGPVQSLVVYIFTLMG